MLISQSLFDETLVESQELFEYDDEQAVQETISELKSQNSSGGAVRLDHLSLTHPNSEKGKKDRQNQKEFVDALSNADLSFAMAIVINATVNDDKSSKALPTFASLVLQHGFFSRNSALMGRFERAIEAIPTDDMNEIELEADELLQFMLAMLPEATTTHPLVRELKLQLGQPLQEQWFPLFEKFPLLRVSLISMARVVCNGCESNKKTLVQAGIRYKPDPKTFGELNAISTNENSGIALLVEILPKDVNSNPKQIMALELSKLLAILGKFQAGAEAAPKDGEAPLVSSAHANVKEFYKCGAIIRLHSLVVQCIEKDKEEILCEALSALRTMAIDNDIVQNMTAVGLLDTVNSQEQDRSLLVHNPGTAAATLGLLRNLCANDEIKSTLCKQSLPSILQAMELHSTNFAVQEHGCGTLAAMSLRQPNNASMIVKGNGAEHIVKSMKAFPLKVPLQRQGCLALRNLASRSSPEEKQVVLDAGAEFVLREIAGRHQDSIDEAYAALRDLGCAAVKYTVDEQGRAQGTQLFGQVQSNFRPVYD